MQRSPTEKQRGPVVLRRRASQRAHHDRPAAARLPRPERLGAHRSVAGAAHPGGVRGGLRLAGRGAPCGHRVRLARTSRDHPEYATGRELGAALAEAGYAVITGGGPGVMEAANRGCSEAGGILDRARHRAAVRAGPQRLGRSRHQLPLLLRPQDDVREVLAGVRVPARRLRHVGRAVRGAHAGADEEGHQVPGRAAGQRLLGRAARLDREDRPRRGKIGEKDMALLHVTDDVDDAVRVVHDAYRAWEDAH